MYQRWVPLFGNTVVVGVFHGGMHRLNNLVLQRKHSTTDQVQVVEHLRFHDDLLHGVGGTLTLADDCCGSKLLGVIRYRVKRTGTSLRATQQDGEEDC